MADAPAYIPGKSGSKTPGKNDKPATTTTPLTGNNLGDIAAMINRMPR